MATDPLASQVDGARTDGEDRADASCSTCFAEARPAVTPPRSMHATAPVSRVPAARGPTFAARGRWPRQPAASGEYDVSVATFAVLVAGGVEEGVDEQAASPESTTAALAYS
jgi:hypothetical protein